MGIDPKLFGKVLKIFSKDLKPSQKIKDIDKKKSIDSRKSYIDAMIRDRNCYFNQKMSVNAADIHERAGKWTKNELLSEKLPKEVFRLPIHKYQREGFLDELKILTPKLTEALIQIFKNRVEVKKINTARYIYEEIENMSESYEIKKSDLD